MFSLVKYNGMKNLSVSSFGPIAEANIDFGDLTLFVGPQASGKSVLSQLVKLLIDKFHIRRVLQQYGYIWSKDTNKILDLYFGEGMSEIWSGKARISFDDKSFTKDFLLPKRGRQESTKEAEEQLFYIPAQRILSVADGRPKTFMEFDASVPYVLRQYSETLRQLLQNGIGKAESIFPINNRLKEPLRNAFNSNIFHNGKIVMDDRTGQKKMRMQLGSMSVPFITWSAGQKEFMPLLLGFYWLCPPSKVSKKDNVKYVVIEEPEMGLHPQAISAVLLQIIDLMNRGYQVIVSTHSPVLLEFAWTVKHLRENHADHKRLAAIFGINSIPPSLKQMFETLLTKRIYTYFFNRSNANVKVKNISSLDSSSDDQAVAEWGGLTSFGAKAIDIVANSVPHE